MKRRLSPFLLLCLLGGLAIFSSTMAKNPALPLFARSLGIPTRVIGFVAAASTVVGILVSLPAGALSDLFGRRRVILISAFIFASAPFLYLLVRGPWALVSVRAYHGLATAILGPVALAAVADAFTVRRGEQMAWYSSATMVGRLLAPTVGGFLIRGEDYRWVYLGCGLAGLLALLTAMGLPGAATEREGTARKGAEGRGDLGAVLTSRDILTTSSMEAVQYLAFGCVEVYLPLYLIGIGLAPWQIGPLFTAQVLTTTLSKPLLGRLSDRWSRKPLITAGLIWGALTVALMPRAQAYPLLLALNVGFGLGLAAVTASTSALVSELARAHGSALGMLGSIKDVGHAAGPMATGLLVAAWGYRPAFAAVAATLAAAAVLFWTVVREPATLRRCES